MISPGQPSWGLQTTLQDQPATAAGDMSRQKYHWLRSGYAWKFTRAFTIQTHCWEGLHLANTVNTQMESSRGAGQGPPPPASQPQPPRNGRSRCTPISPLLIPLMPRVFPPGKRPLWPLLIQLDSSKQSTPGGTGRWPSLLREVWKNPGSREPGRAPQSSSWAFSATL